MHAISRIVWQPGPAAAPSWRELWQAPAFVLGLLALLGVVVWLLFGPVTAGAALARELAAAQEALAAGDAETAHARAKAALQNIQATPQLAGELHFVCGSATFLRAEAAQGPDRAALFAQALNDLRAAERLGIHKDRQPRLQYRRAVAEYGSGGDPGESARAIEAALEGSPADRLAGYALLVQLHLNRSKPNLEAALKANERLLAQGELSNPNPARLQRGELLLRRQERNDARIVLARIPPTAPEYAEARHLRAWSHYQDSEWQAAIDLWAPALRAEDARLPHLQQVLYALGYSYAVTDRLAEAQTAWLRVCREAPGSDEAVAAGLRLGLLYSVRGGQHDDALAQYTQALRGLRANWRSPYMDALEAREIIECQWSAWMEMEQHFELARRLAQLYQQIALPGEATRRLAQASQKAGLALLRQAEGAASADRERLAAQGRRLLGEAGEAYERAVRELQAEGDRGELLWSTAGSYLQAQESGRAAEVLEVYLREDLPAQRRQEAQVALGEAYQALGRSQAAAELLRAAAAQAGPLQLRARYLLALVQIDSGKYDAAEQVLKEIMLMPALDRRDEEWRSARSALVHVLFRRQAFAEAADYLEKGMEQDALHPQVLETRYWLAEAYRRAARQEKNHISSADTAAARDFYLKQKRQQLERALGHFRHVVAELDKAAAGRQLAVDETTRLRDSRQGMGECLFNLGRYDDAIEVYRTQVEREGNSVAALTAAMHLTHCWLTLKKVDEAKQAAASGRALLDRLSDPDLEAAGQDRQAWQDWFDNAAASPPASKSQ